MIENIGLLWAFLSFTSNNECNLLSIPPQVKVLTHSQKSEILVLDCLEHRLLREVVDTRQPISEHAVHVADLPGEPHGGDDGGHAVAHRVAIAALHHSGHWVTIGDGGAKLLKFISENEIFINVPF